MKDKLIKILEMMTSNEGTLFTYAFAYSIIAGIAPFIIIAVVFVGRYVYNVDQLMDFLQRFVPADLVIPFVEYLTASDMSNLWLIVSLLGASVWLASKSVYSFLLLSSEHDGVETRHFFLRILAIIYFVFIIIGVGLVAFVIGFFPFINRFSIPWILFIFFLLFYRLLSFKYTGFKDVWYGAVFSSVAIAVFGRIFFFYINEYSNYQTIYGPLASFMILLISGWFISWVIYAGYCINFVFRDEDKPITQKSKLIQFLDKGDR
ncbi:YihY/virulence factor BrkB family protein [Erysipelothrix urinaevulpis]|uniref:YihY/virulence factor BrkB family protein n=1 Tax=Erysipelothrix urinaevulpis TaxID=2683717 RepID=UPI00135CB4B8|nr:YhjD/YihY/BrkB family envelope integrity protein [Erysipelothrix urinaevulpis]